MTFHHNLNRANVILTAITTLLKTTLTSAMITIRITLNAPNNIHEQPPPPKHNNNATTNNNSNKTKLHQQPKYRRPHPGRRSSGNVEYLSPRKCSLNSICVTFRKACRNVTVPPHAMALERPLITDANTYTFLRLL